MFYVLLFAFVLIGAVVVLYANGWRFNPFTLELKKVGAIYARSYPIDAKIYLNGGSVENKSGFFQSGTFINDLFPGNYKLKLVLSGYKTWEESVSVSPSLVSEVKYAVLIPEKSADAATGTIKNFRLLGSKILAGDFKNNVVLGDKKIGRGDILEWTSDFKNILTYNGVLGRYFLYNTDLETNTDVNLLLGKTGFNAKQGFRAFLEPEDKRMLVILQQNKLYELNLGETSITNIFKTNLELGEKITSSQFYIAWTQWNSAENSSTLVVYDKFLQRKRPGSPELRGKNSELEWLRGKNKIAILQNDGSLYVYDVSSGNLDKIADDVKNFSFTDGGDAVAALEHKSLEVFFFSADKDYYRFNVPNVGQAEKIIWYADKNHLFIVYPAEIKFLDIQNASLDYFPSVAEGRLPQYDESNNRLYFLTNDGLKTLDFPK